MNKYLKGTYKMPHSKGSRWECYICGQSVPDGRQNEHAIEHVKLVPVKKVSGGGK